ncbi:MAG: Mrp/NBP35 family ATP-binding protein [Gemmatimonadaceae bacterium]|nr:Mrp/NBP35 family ATP-binding protein [Gemmatimonadaceae bacterium]
MLTEQQVRDALAEVAYPGLRRDIVALGLVRSVAVRDGRVHVSLTLSTEREEVPGLLRAAIVERLQLAGAVRTEVQLLTPERKPVERDPWARQGRLPGAQRIIAVGAGKGGVGKSTVAVNLALALQESGLRVGILDADIYGPSVPVLLGLEDGAFRAQMTPEKQIVPLEAHGLAVVSFGFFLGAGSPAVWRGPMVGKAVTQFSRGVVWPGLDILVVDLPPGTGDVPLSLAQSVVVDGAIVVTTPQRLAALEAAKAVEMFRTLDVPVLGVVENMSHATCECGRRSHPFGKGGGADLARTSGVPLLGALPFDESAVDGGDRGAPIMVQTPHAEIASALRTIAEMVRSALQLEVQGVESAS